MSTLQSYSTNTSAAAWRLIKDSPKLSELRRNVAYHIAEAPGSTATEIYNMMAGLSQHSVTPRFKELFKMGVIVYGEQRTCKISGFQANTYYINPHITEAGIKPYGLVSQEGLTVAPKLREIKTEAELRAAINRIPHGEIILVKYPFGELRSTTETGYINFKKEDFLGKDRKFTLYRCRI